MKVLAVDDEYLALKLLEEFIAQVPELQPAGFVKSPMEALEILQEQNIDLLFLDIQMPTLSGNNLLKSLPHPPLTIFTTAYANYAAEAFDLDAVDYLLKPFSFERFLKAVNKAKEMHRRRQGGTPPALLANKPPGKDFLAVKVDGTLKKIYFKDILFVEGLKEYVRIHCDHGRYVVLNRMKSLVEVLPSNNFMRVHKSYIIACDRVRGIDGNMLEIGEHRIPVSRGKREEVVKRIFYSKE